MLLSGESHIATHTMYDLLDPDIRERIHGDTFVVSTRHPNVSRIPNIEESSALDIPLGRRSPDSFRILQQRLPRILSSKLFDVVLIDNPPSIGLWLTISLAASDFAIVPIDAASGYSLDGLRKVLDLIDAIRKI
ncbi:ParA family protein [Desulfacinum hydrothermale]|uniref:ParA family protein n=1 Tax=Desulfacinum hydrothermale TaxID=109258 RepID=UPI000A07738E|nr:ParA family protein [Desulfacinum hydrothermale]